MAATGPAAQPIGMSGSKWRWLRESGISNRTLDDMPRNNW